jgi:hypothetical protein
MSSGLYYCIVRRKSDVSEKPIVSIFRVENVRQASRLLLLIPYLAYDSTQKMMLSSRTSSPPRLHSVTTQIDSNDRTRHGLRCEILKPIIVEDI